MKKTFLCILICLLSLPFSACHSDNNSIVLNPDISVFSYAQHEASYLSGESGGIVDGFKNITATQITTKEEAIDRAKNEVTIDYTEISVYYDGKTSMWMIVFGQASYYDENQNIVFISDGCQSVYLDSNGITKLIYTADDLTANSLRRVLSQ